MGSLERSGTAAAVGFVEAATAAAAEKASMLHCDELQSALLRQNHSNLKETQKEKYLELSSIYVHKHRNKARKIKRDREKRTKVNHVLVK